MTTEQTPEEWLRSFEANAKELAARAEAAQQAMAANRATAENQFLRITMSGGGTVDEIEFLPAASRASAAQLNEAFKDAHSRAGAEVAKVTMGVMTELAGPDDPSVDLIRRNIPADVVEAMEAEEEDR